MGNNGTAVLTQSGNSSINTGSGEFWVGNNPGNGSAVTSGVYNLSGGSLTVGSFICIGRRFNTTGVVNMTGGVITETSNNQFIMGEDNSSGTLNQSNGVININGPTFYLGDGGGGYAGSGVFNLSGGSFSMTNQMIVGVNSGASGLLNQSGGVANVASWFRIGQYAGSSGTCIVSASTLNVGSVSSKQELNVGEDGAGVMNITGGQVTVGGAVNVGGPSQDGKSSGTGILNLSGNAVLTVTTNNPLQMLGTNRGTATMTIGGNASVINTSTGGDPEFVVGYNGTAVLTQSGNSSINTGSGEFWVGNNANGSSAWAAPAASTTSPAGR